DAVELATSLYNQVEEKLHMLVMRSNESLQHLEVLLRHREMEAKIISEGLWFSSEGEQILKNSYTTDDTLVGREKALKDFNLFLAKVKLCRDQCEETGCSKSGAFIWTVTSREVRCYPFFLAVG
ncbi:hypothetical protein AMECASPLE_026798, partial [Ameca splendens]